MRTSVFRQSLCSSNTFTYVAVLDNELIGFSMLTSPGIEPQFRRPLSWMERFVDKWCSLRSWFISNLSPRMYVRLFIPALGQTYLDRRREDGRKNNNFFECNISSDDKTSGYWMLNFLCIVPEYKSKGVGARLLAKALKRAESDGRSVYTGATPEGKLLYQRRGFESIASMVNGGGRSKEHQWTSTVMRWRPS